MQAYEDFADAIYRHCYFRVSDKPRAEEIMQETFMRVWKYMADGGKVNDYRAFLYRTANNLVINEYLRRSKRRELSMEELHERGFDIPSEEHQKIEQHLANRQIMGMLDACAPEHRELLIMRYIDDMSPREIAKIRDETENAVSIRLHRALKKIRTAVVGDAKYNWSQKSNQ